MSDHPLAIMKWLADAGDDIALADAPIDRFAESEAMRDAKRATSKTRADIAERAKAVAGKIPALEKTVRDIGSRTSHITLPNEDVVVQAAEIAAAAKTLNQLRQAVENFSGCNLKASAKHTVFADGNSKAQVMLMGEAPGQEEDLQGLPFVGKSGQLLDRMLAAIGLDRTSVYITNLIAWRPPGNRAPTPAESAICRPFALRHIELAGPKILVLVGGSSAKALLQTDEGILRLRGQWKEIKIKQTSFATIATLHPSYLLRQPAQKALAWQDLLKIKARLNSLA